MIHIPTVSLDLIGQNQDLVQDFDPLGVRFDSQAVVDLPIDI